MAESEMYAASNMGKLLKWVHVWMLDIGVPYTEAIPVGEDNEAACIIGHHSSRLTCNVRHIAIQMANLQSLVCTEIMAMFCVGSANNTSNLTILPSFSLAQHSPNILIS